MKKEEIAREQKHLDETIRKIEDYIYLLSQDNERKKEQILQRRDMIGDYETYRNNKLYQQLMETAKKEPYFGSFETFSEEEGKEKWYIGKHGIYDRDYNIVVLDWRRPMASVFYNFTPGNPKQSFTIHTADQGIITNHLEVLNKKEYTIENQKIKRIVQQVADVDSNLNMSITEEGESSFIRDDFLRNIVESRETTGYMKDIIATIQREQDQAIREPLDKHLIVQGVAGSGKSAIALHRLSYLLYNNRLMKPEDSLIIGPSKLFISSVKDLLPELEIEEVGQTTITDLMLDILGEQAKDVHLSLKTYFENVLSGEQRDEYVKMIEFKGSSKIIEIVNMFINAYILNYENQLPSIEMFNTILSREELKKIYDGYQYLPFLKRIEKFKEHVRKYFEDKRKDEIEKVNESFEFVVKYLKENSGLSKKELQDSLVVVEKVKKYKIDRARSTYVTEIKQWEKKVSVPRISTLYKRFLTKEFIQVLTQDEAIHQLFDHYKIDELDYFDLAPLCYMNMLLNGTDKKYSHIVIDEGQDLSIAHYSVLKKICHTMTILGDYNQSIYGNYGQTDWQKLRNSGLFQNDDISILTLETSYRSTKQIIDAANRVRSNYFGNKHIPIVPLNWNGEDVKIHSFHSGKELLKNTKELLSKWKKKYKRIAIIHNDEDKAKKFAEALQNEFHKDVVYISPDETIQENTISVLTSYQSKGMEFDAVLLVNVSDETFPSREFHATLLYVMMTRAQHELQIFYKDAPSTLLDGLVEKTVTMEDIYEDIY